ncbi:MAG: hypothetical protein K2Y14_01255 [Burkholderiales bacterium]|nr:hypothetical protein [Burkholderiales bacterium]
MKKLISILVATLIAGCVSSSDLQNALNDKVNMKLLLDAVTPDYSLWNSHFFTEKCYNEWEISYVNSCARFVNSNCVSEYQKNACDALDIRLKKQGYHFNSSDLLDAYIKWQNELSDQRKAEEQKNINNERQQLIESMADGKNI